MVKHWPRLETIELPILKDPENPVELYLYRTYSVDGKGPEHRSNGGHVKVPEYLHPGLKVLVPLYLLYICSIKSARPGCGVQPLEEQEVYPMARDM